MHGHLWTIAPLVRDTALPPRPPPSRRWRATVVDPDVGPVALSGALSGGGRHLVIVVHGLGGRAETSYCVRFARVAAARGVATLRLNLRGADLEGADFYHAGLTADLGVALASPEVAAFERVTAVGFSLGGHVVLRRAASEPGRLAAVAALCSPLDLAATSRHIERPVSTLYRLHLLRGLRAMYGAVAARRPVPLSPAALGRVTSLREWDERVVAPRFGFAGADDYYRAASVAPHLGGLAIPALYLGVDRDPMVSRASVEPALEGARGALTVEWLRRGGHVGFPGDAAIYRRVLDFLAG